MPRDEDDEQRRVTPEAVAETLRERLALLEKQVADVVADARRDLISIVETLTLDTMVSRQEHRRLQSESLLAPRTKRQKAYVERLRASTIASNADLAERLKVSESLISLYFRGSRPIPRSRALEIQSLTRSAQFPEGIEPTELFWPGGIVG